MTTAKYSSHVGPNVGLPFRDLVNPQQLDWEALSGRTLAVDGYNAIYQFLSTIRQRDGQPFTDGEGRTTSHLMGVFYRTTALLGDGVLPVWVFDGKPPELKAGTLRSRFVAKERAQAEWDAALARGDLVTAKRKAAQTSRLTPTMAQETMEMLAALGVPTVQAPSEGEAQASAMAAAGQAWAVASEDYDSLLFGAPRLVRGLAARGGRSGQRSAQLIDHEQLLAELGISQEELLLIGILVGTDFNEGAEGFGPKKALKLVREHRGWEATLAAAGLSATEVEPVAEIFRHPHTATDLHPVFGPIDDEQVLEILVRRHGFSEPRVRGGIGRARRRPAPRPGTDDGRSHQTLLEAFGGAPP